MNLNILKSIFLIACLSISGFAQQTSGILKNVTVCKTHLTAKSSNHDKKDPCIQYFEYDKKSQKLYVRERLTGHKYSYGWVAVNENFYQELECVKISDLSFVERLKTKFYAKSTQRMKHEIQQIFFDGDYVYFKNTPVVYYSKDNNRKAASALQEKPARLTIITDQEDLTVFLNDIEINAVPYTIAFDPSKKVNLLVAKPNHPFMENQIQLIPNKNTVISFNLSRIAEEGPIGDPENLKQTVPTKKVPDSNLRTAQIK
ncbi:MAG: hypothetical protein HQK83_04010 [Fibrobacteria bacterium]|nr:hypothetical protein [Fibrobacteria bacterium]